MKSPTYLPPLVMRNHRHDMSPRRFPTERTLILLKPDALQRGIAMHILERFERRGLRIVGLKLVSVNKSEASRHYAEHEGKFFFDGLVAHLQSGPVVASILEGPKAISIVRAMVGSTRPDEAAPGTIRGDLAISGLRNLIHASDAPETAAREIGQWFGSGDILDYERNLDEWVYEAD